MLQFHLEMKSSFSIHLDYKVDVHCWHHTVKETYSKN